MAKVVMVCGKICSGKSTYSEKLRTECYAVMLSVDELMLTFFGQNTGEKHDEYVRKVKEYLLKKIPELISVGLSVILDWGFWTRQERDFTKNFCRMRDIDCELHYIDITDEVWKQCIKKRNETESAGKSEFYFIDKALFEKFSSVFEIPDKSEIDVFT